MAGASTVLMLQGPLGPLYGQIAGHLMAAGARVIRVNFSGNDVADWPHGHALSFRGRPEGWPDFLAREIAPLGVDAVLLHGDRRPYHKAAAAWAGAQSVDVLVTELGYLRPDWMILERGGSSALSRFPLDPERIRASAAACPEVDFTPRWQNAAWPLILGEIRFTLLNALMRARFPHYVSHRAEPAWRVYSGWLAGRARGAVNRALHRILRRSGARPVLDAPRFVFALQLEGDLQLRDHTPFRTVAGSVDHVVASFAAHAPPGTVLILKPHPHEFARARLMTAIATASARHGLQDRVQVVENHTIDGLCRGAAGFVTMNSSAGIEALGKGCPVHCVMPTVYDVPGLTHQGGLDAFWAGAGEAVPDAGLFRDLRRALAGAVQVRGTIYDRQGCDAAASAMAARILTGTINAPGAWEDRPPRLAKAAAMGVRYD